MHLNRLAGMATGIAIVAAHVLGGLAPAAIAQPADRTLHVGILSSGTLELRASLDRAFIDALREQGYVEGRNLVVERRYGSASVRNSASELAGMKLDAVLTTCSPSTRIMKEATSSTPIVMAAVSDPVRQGLIASLAKPGQNVTGTSSQAEDLLAKRLELLAALVPRSTKIAVLANANNPVHALGWQTLEATALKMKLDLVRFELKSGADLPAAMEAASRAQANALFVLPDDPMMLNLRPQLVELAAKYRMPDFYWASQFAEAGGLMSYGENLRNSYRAAASYMDRIKHGARPSEMPVEQPTRFDLVINLKAARAFGIAVPQALLLQADEVIE